MSMEDMTIYLEGLALGLGLLVVSGLGMHWFTSWLYRHYEDSDWD